MQILGCLEADRWNDASAYPWTSISRSGICGWRFIAALSISIINNWLFSPIFLCFMAKAQLSIGARSVPVGAHSHLDPCNHASHASMHPCAFLGLWICGFAIAARRPVVGDDFIRKCSACRPPLTNLFWSQNQRRASTRETWYAAININHVISTVLRGPRHVSAFELRLPLPVPVILPCQRHDLHWNVLIYVPKCA